LEELLKLESNKKIDNYKLNPMKTRICNYFYKRKLYTLPIPVELDESDIHKLKTMNKSKYNPEFLKKFE